MAAVRAATGEGRGSGISALLPAVLAAGAGSGASSALEAPATFDRTSGDDTRGYPTFPAITPEIKKEAVALAKTEIPKKEQSGFGYEDLLMFGLQLMAGKSQYALQNVGEAGVAALTAKQAREKVEYDRRKTDAEIKGLEATAGYHKAAADRYTLEDKPAAQMRKELAAAYAKIDADPFMKLDHIKMAAAKRQADAEIGARYAELAGTMGGAGGKTGNPLVDKYLQ
jgi:hypothetical protein